MNYLQFLILTGSMFICSALFAETTRVVDSIWQQSSVQESTPPKERVTLDSGPILFKSTSLSIHYSNKTAFALLMNQPHYLGFMPQETPVEINTVKLTPSSSSMLSLTPMQFPNFVEENELFLKKITDVLNLYRNQVIKEIGFLKADPQTHTPVMTHVEQLSLLNSQRYILSFDGSELVYFNIPQTLSDTNTHSPSSQANKAKSLFSSMGKVLLPKVVKNSIIDNSINKGEIREANHISVIDDRIILDTQEVRVNNLPETLGYQKQAIDAIKMRTKAQASEDLLSITWKARRRHISN